MTQPKEQLILVIEGVLDHETVGTMFNLIEWMDNTLCGQRVDAFLTHLRDDEKWENPAPMFSGQFNYLDYDDEEERWSPGYYIGGDNFEAALADLDGKRIRLELAVRQNGTGAVKEEE